MDRKQVLVPAKQKVRLNEKETERERAQTHFLEDSSASLLQNVRKETYSAIITECNVPICQGGEHGMLVVGETKLGFR